MQKKIQIKISPVVAASEQLIKKELALQAGCPEKNITGFHLLKRSLDARSRYPHILLTAESLSMNLFIQEPSQVNPPGCFPCFQIGIDYRCRTRGIICGAPADPFRHQAVILERGKEVRARRRDLAILNKEGIINPESNYCFGEGGAGTYSDGKLYTRSNKRGDIQRILNLFVQFGAEESISI